MIISHDIVVNRNAAPLSNSCSPHQLQTDKGKEFYNTLLSKWLRDKGIRHFSIQGDVKAGLVERFNRTLKGRMYRYFTTANTLKYIDVVQDLVEGYNGTPHRSMGMAPRDVTPENDDNVWMKLYGGKHKLKIPAFATGDRVRLAQKTRPFKKGYLPGWTEEVFVVRHVIPGKIPTHKIEEFVGTSVEGTFYEEELQKVSLNDESLFRIEKVLRRRGNRLYVQWKGWPSKYNSWVNRKDVQSV